MDRRGGRINISSQECALLAVPPVESDLGQHPRRGRRDNEADAGKEGQRARAPLLLDDSARGVSRLPSALRAAFPLPTLLAEPPNDYKHRHEEDEEQRQMSSSVRTAHQL